METARLKNIAQPLLKWYESHARVLPWRNDPTPYRVLVSEFMLQQTRVETVIPYFERFVNRLPDIPALAGADEHSLFKLWEGLGYYSRARNLQNAARMIQEEFDGIIPKSYKDLIRLPGIGPYTAGAVASIAYGVPLPAVDGNVLRVVSRITASKENVSDLNIRRTIEKSIQEILPNGRAGDFNQALMEIGATICLPCEPKCEACPLLSLCKGAEMGIPSSLPVKSIKASRRIENKTVFVLIYNGKLAIQRFPAKGLLAGLWGLPASDGELTEDFAQRALTKWRLPRAVLLPLPRARHIFTHLEWHMTGFLASIPAFAQDCPFTWASQSEIKNSYALPSAYRAYVEAYYRFVNK